MVNPASSSWRTALALRPPILQCTTISGASAPRGSAASCFGKLAQRNQRRSRDAADLKLIRLAHVEDEQPIAAIDARLQIVDGCLRHRCGRVRGPARRRRTARNRSAPSPSGRRRRPGTSASRRSFSSRNLIVEGVVQQEPADQRLTDAEDQLDRLGRLDRADHARQDAEHAAFRAARHLPRRRRLRVEAAVARTARARRTPTPARRSGRCCRRRSACSSSTQASLTRYRVGKLSVPSTMTS